VSLDAVLSRISEIRSQIATLQDGAATTTSASSAASSSAFADALADATGAGSSTATTTPATTGSATTASVDAVPDAEATGSGKSGDDVVAAAKQYLGVPYVFGGTTRAGMDCSGLVQTVFKDLGVTMPRVVPDQAKMGVAVPSLAEAQPGDLIIPKGEGHVVIYVGDGKVLHAPHPGKDVRIVDNWYKDSDIATIRRIVPSGQEAAQQFATQGTSALTAALQRSGTSSTSRTDLQTAALMSLLNGGSAG
jgi:peptidoglycan DL-endopeptidase CwlO